MMSLTALLIVFAAVLGSSVMMAVFAWVFMRIRSLESGGGGRSDIERLTEEVDGLRAELQATHSDISDLTERLDFTERLLSGPRAEEPE